MEALTLANDYCASIKVFVTSTIEGLLTLTDFYFTTRTGCDRSDLPYTSTYTCSIIPETQIATFPLNDNAQRRMPLAG